MFENGEQLEYGRLEGCCGAVEISGFGYNENDLGPGDISVRETEKELKKVMARYDVSGKAFLIITLIRSQHLQYKNMLIRNKFKLVSQAYHPSHKNQIYLWVRSYKKNSKRPTPERTRRPRVW